MMSENGMAQMPNTVTVMNVRTAKAMTPKNTGMVLGFPQGCRREPGALLPGA
jgi:hypothetical protein